MSGAARWMRVGTLAAIALLLSYVETFLPIPIPGVKLGLANMAVVAELGLQDASGAACIALIKVLASGLLFGSPLTMVYSATGTLLSLAGMIPLSRLRTMRLWMVSVVGATLHVVGQLAVAQALLRTPAVWYMLPALMAAACVTGALCGVLAESLRTALPTEEEFGDARVDVGRLEPRVPQAGTLASFAGLVAFAVLVLHLSDMWALAGCVVVALVACLAARVRPRSIARTIPPMVGVATLTFALQYVAMDADAHAAALETARACACLASLVLSSRAFAALLRPEDLTGNLAWLMRPLRALGMDTRGFLLAFDVAIRLVPLLGDVMQQERIGLRELPRRLPSIVHEVCLRAASLSDE